jgi:hypothetical protein
VKELIGDEIEAASFSSRDILGEDFGFTVEDVHSLSEGTFVDCVNRVAALEILAFRGDTACSPQEIRALRADASRCIGALQGASGK